MAAPAAVYSHHADVKLVMSTHGMPWDRVPHADWIELSLPYVTGRLAALQALDSILAEGRPVVASDSGS